MSQLYLLFWLSLVPFATGWMGENHFVPWPVVVCGIVLLCAAIACYLLTHALGRDLKGKISPLFHAMAIGLAFVNVWLACALYVGVALMWLVPDLRIERVLVKAEE